MGPADVVDVLDQSCIHCVTAGPVSDPLGFKIGAVEEGILPGGILHHFIGVTAGLLIEFPVPVAEIRALAIVGVESAN